MKASELKNTPWVIEVDPDGTCDIYATDKERESRLRWIAAAIDEPTAKAIADLPDTLKELEAVKSELEMSKYTGQSAVNELHRYKQETDEIVKGLKSELEKSKKAKRYHEQQHKRLQRRLRDSREQINGLKSELENVKEQRAVFDKTARRLNRQLEQAQAERDELRAFVETTFKSSLFPSPVDWVEMYKQAQQLLNTPE